MDTLSDTGDIAVPAVAGLPALPASVAMVPLGQPATAVRDWFDAAAEALIPDHDETLGTARQAADA